MLSPENKNNYVIKQTPVTHFVDDSSTFHYSLSTNQDQVNLLHHVTVNRVSHVSTVVSEWDQTRSG